MNPNKRSLVELMKDMEESLESAHTHFQAALNILKPPVPTHEGIARYSTINDLIAGR